MINTYRIKRDISKNEVMHVIKCYDYEINILIVDGKFISCYFNEYENIKLERTNKKEIEF